MTMNDGRRHYKHKNHIEQQKNRHSSLQVQMETGKDSNRETCMVVHVCTDLLDPMCMGPVAHLRHLFTSVAQHREPRKPLTLSTCPCFGSCFCLQRLTVSGGNPSGVLVRVFFLLFAGHLPCFWRADVSPVVLLVQESLEKFETDGNGRSHGAAFGRTRCWLLLLAAAARHGTFAGGRETTTR